MAKKTELERLNIWKNRVGWSKKFKEPIIKEYQEFIKYFIGDQYNVLKETAIGNEAAIIINLMFSHIKATLPMLYFQNPTFYLDATSMQFEERKHIAQETLNYIVRKEKLKREIRLATLDGLFLMGVCKTGYNPVFGINANKGRDITLGNDEDGNPIYVIDPETGEKMVEPDEILIKEEFFTKRVPLRNMLFDPENKNFVDDHAWIGEEVIWRLDDAKECEYFNKSYRDKLKETHLASNEAFVTDGTYEGTIKEDLQRIKLIHIYDLRDESFKIYAEGQEDNIGFLYEEDTPDGIDGHPYSILKFHEIPDEWWPLSEIKILKPIQDEFNKMINILGSHAKKFLRKYGYEEGAFADDDQLEMFKEPVDGMMVKFNKNALERFKALDDATQDPATDNYLNRLMVNFWQTAGRTEAERGNVERRKTMFESSQIEKYGQLRSADSMSLVEDFVRDIGVKKLNQIQANLRVPLAVKIMGKEGQRWEENITKEEIHGDYDLTVDVGSTGPKIPELEREQLMQFLDKISGIPNLDQILIMPTEEGLYVSDLIKELGEFYDIDVEKFIKPKGKNRTQGDIGMMEKILEMQMKQGGSGRPQGNRGNVRPMRQKPPRRAQR